MRLCARQNDPEQWSLSTEYSRKSTKSNRCNVDVRLVETRVMRIEVGGTTACYRSRATTALLRRRTPSSPVTRHDVDTQSDESRSRVESTENSETESNREPFSSRLGRRNRGGVAWTESELHADGVNDRHGPAARGRASGPVGSSRRYLLAANPISGMSYLFLPFAPRISVSIRFASSTSESSLSSPRSAITSRAARTATGSRALTAR